MLVAITRPPGEGAVRREKLAGDMYVSSTNHHMMANVYIVCLCYVSQRQVTLLNYH